MSLQRQADEARDAHGHARDLLSGIVSREQRVTIIVQDHVLTVHLTQHTRKKSLLLLDICIVTTALKHVRVRVIFVLNLEYFS